MNMKKASEFQLHAELTGLFEVFVIPIAGGTRFQFYPFKGREAGFPEYLQERFAHLGKPGECVFHADIQCFDVTFPGLRLASPEEALAVLLRPPSTPKPASAPGAATRR